MPSKEELEAARGKLLDDLLAPGLDVVFAGINPGLYSTAMGFHFARPGNRFWPALHGGGFTPRKFDPGEQHELLELGIGITNVVARTTARADELSKQELREGGEQLAAKMREFRPNWLAVVGITAYRTAFSRPRAVVGPQDERIGDTRLWVLPNPSGLNAHWTPAGLAEEFGRLRTAVINSQ
ncbi:TDG/mug DNA glycosylase family protein [Amycolatopsis xylanica]|uniref:TDG/mug DNA glycosylase family protein n=1 Tax=Amycolatopsis xylanica TaxID=589385 RepID=A0A1H3AAW2_9PSEU|nr:G/U mismatch-specific DNA glycosylase [Amycolatopsis xylanica]SDX26860.1 TDG/mug DNA glycosylase family protein [Amycolatopsis xylanica]